MTKEQFLALASARYEALSQLGRHGNFYDYEKEFDKIWVELGRDVLEQRLGDIPEGRGKKKDSRHGTGRSQ